LSQKTTMTTI